MKRQMLKIAFMGITGVLLFGWANAAPTVKKLGTSSNANGASVKANNATPSRAASVRFDTSKTSAKTVPANTATPNKASNASTDSEASRLSMGKYLQVVHSVKPDAATGYSTQPGLSSSEAIELKDRISAAENEITTVKDDMNDHIGNVNIHVSVSEKETWNEKQDHLTAGEGIEIEDNVVSATMKLPVGSADAPHTAPIWVE